MKTTELLASAPLGRKSSYISSYTPQLLFPLPRKPKRDEIGIQGRLPFQGFDLWNGFEISWLNPSGKPIVAIAEFQIPSDSEYLIESKSFKLYLNSFNQTQIKSFEQAHEIMTKDLSEATGAPVKVQISRLTETAPRIGSLKGVCLDDLDIQCTEYQPNSSYLVVTGEKIEETLNTNLLKSNCLVTGQPDWGSLEISYRGQQISHEGLLKYIVSFRDHQEFHEQCVERIFMNIMRQCRPVELSILARYTRRGGLDINPFRTNRPIEPEFPNHRLIRQ